MESEATCSSVEWILRSNSSKIGQFTGCCPSAQPGCDEFTVAEILAVETILFYFSVSSANIIKRTEFSQKIFGYEEVKSLLDIRDRNFRVDRIFR